MGADPFNFNQVITECDLGELMQIKDAFKMPGTEWTAKAIYDVLSAVKNVNDPSYF